MESKGTHERLLSLPQARSDQKLFPAAQRNLYAGPYAGHGNFVSLPNEVFLLGLSAGELAVYSYLMRCEDRKTHQCHPSYRTIGRAVHLSQNTVAKHVNGLREKLLIVTENTEIVTRRGEKRNGTLLYTIRPVEKALRHFYEQQMHQLETVKDQETIRKKLAELDRKRERAG